MPAAAARRGEPSFGTQSELRSPHSITSGPSRLRPFGPADAASRVRSGDPAQFRGLSSSRDHVAVSPSFRSLSPPASDDGFPARGARAETSASAPGHNEAAAPASSVSAPCRCPGERGGLSTHTSVRCRAAVQPGSMAATCSLCAAVIAAGTPIHSCRLCKPWHNVSEPSNLISLARRRL